LKAVVVVVEIVMDLQVIKMDPTERYMLMNQDMSYMFHLL